MLLALSVISHQSHRLGTTGYRIFDERGGSIGRGKSNDWILDDPELVLSTRHAQISFSSGAFKVEDLSTNGTGLNRSDSMVPKGQWITIGDGDRLFLGDFEILAQVIADPPKAVSPAPSVPSLPARAPISIPRQISGPVPIAATSLSSQAIPSLTAVAPSLSASSLSELLQEAAPPALTPVAAPSISALSHSGLSVARSAVPPEPAEMTGDLGSLLAAAGLQPNMVRPEILGQLGDILQIVTGGLMDVLKARKEIKNQFRMTATIMRSVENNPLKFDASAGDAMHTLFVKCNPGWLGPQEAYREAFDDLGRHQLATLAGMQAAFAAVLKRFQPEGIEKMSQRSARGGLLAWFNKPNYWNFYRGYYEKLSQDSEAAFQQLFGEAFVRAYDEQMRRLEAAGSHQP